MAIPPLRTKLIDLKDSLKDLCALEDSLFVLRRKSVVPYQSMKCFVSFLELFLFPPLKQGFLPLNLSPAVQYKGFQFTHIQISLHDSRSSFSFLTIYSMSSFSFGKVMNAIYFLSSSHE